MSKYAIRAPIETANSPLRYSFLVPPLGLPDTGYVRHIPGIRTKEARTWFRQRCTRYRLARIPPGCTALSRTEDRFVRYLRPFFANLLFQSSFCIYYVRSDSVEILYMVQCGPHLPCRRQKQVRTDIRTDFDAPRIRENMTPLMCFMLSLRPCLPGVFVSHGLGPSLLSHRSGTSGSSTSLSCRTGSRTGTHGTGLPPARSGSPSLPALQ